MSENCDFVEGTYSVVNDLSMTRKRVSTTSNEDYHLQTAAELDTTTQAKNKLPKFEYVTQISGPSPITTPHHHHQHLLTYCETVDFHNEKGQRIFLTESENAEFVNIMLQENLLSVQTPMHSATTSQPHSAELLELNADLLDLDHKGAKGAGVACEEGSFVTFVNNSGHEIDFEKQLVRVEIQDASSSPPTVIRGQSLNICNPTTRREYHHPLLQQNQHGNNGKVA